MRMRVTVISVLVMAAVAAGQESSRRSSERERSSSRSERSSRARTASAEPSGTRGATTRPAGFIDEYRLVLDRNIFSKNRVIYREPGTGSTAPSTATVTHRQEPALLVTGVTMEGGVATALIEDRRTGRASIYRVGEALGDGTITRIGIDAIDYTLADGQVDRVELGRVIESGPMYSVSSSSSAASSGSVSGSGAGGASSGSASPSTSAGGGDAGDILERLRRKRLEETKR